MILYLPREAPRLISQVTAHVDIVPTIMHHGLGIDADISSYSNGHDLLEDLPLERPVIVSSYVNYAVVCGEDVSVVYPMYVENYRLWDIHSRADRTPPIMALRAIEEMRLFYQPDSAAQR